jgi:hypothetical protein
MLNTGPGQNAVSLSLFLLSIVDAMIIGYFLLSLCHFGTQVIETGERELKPRSPMSHTEFASQFAPCLFTDDPLKKHTEGGVG